MCDRPALLEVFCRGWPTPPDGTRILRQEVLAALQHFGCVQLDRYSAPPSRSLAAYLPPVRTIVFRGEAMRATRRSPTTLEALRRDFVALRRREGPRRGVNISFGRTGGEEALNPLEFYAEGYAVLRCGPLENQGRLLRFAPGLYDYLEAESQRHGLPLPSRERVEAAAEQAFRTAGGR